MLPPPCFPVGMVPAFFKTWYLAFRPELNPGFIRPENLECLGAFWQSPSGWWCLLLRSGFRLVTTIKAWLVECCRDGCPSGRFSPSPQRNSGALSETIGFLGIGKEGDLLPRLLSLAGRSALGRVLVVPNFFHLRMIEATVFLGTFNAADMFWYPFPDLCLDTILSWPIPPTSFLQPLLWHALSTVGPYIDRCVPFQIISNQLNLPQVDSNQVVETRMINGNRMHLSSISSLIAKGLNTYVNKVFQFFILIY